MHDRAEGEHMPYSLAQAAKAVGRDRSTLSRMIKTGKVSATRDEATGGWLIDPAELHRVYPPVHEQVETPSGAPPRTAVHDEDAIRVRDDMIADLRARLDRSEAERIAAQARVMALLEAHAPAAARRSWLPWRR